MFMLVTHVTCNMYAIAPAKSAKGIPSQHSFCLNNVLQFHFWANYFCPILIICTDLATAIILNVSLLSMQQVVLNTKICSGAIINVIFTGVFHIFAPRSLGVERFTGASVYRDFSVHGTIRDSQCPYRGTP